LVLLVLIHTDIAIKLLITWFRRESVYSSFGGVVLCDSGRKQAAASGIGVQWGRQTDKTTFTYTGMQSTSCPKMTLRYEKNIVQNFSLFLG